MFKQIAVILTAGLAACVPQGQKVERQMVGLLEKFDRWDYDGNGRLTLKELREAEELSGMPAEEILSFYDKNGDGSITLIEAQSGMSRLDEAKKKATTLRKEG